ncbi:MAG: hypothetical protein LBT37_03485 [Lactobacillaceae bacterium]|jgi:hypothetical protein|nr:hypothetical protein [Lactobacillaceae bacterium]
MNKVTRILAAVVAVGLFTATGIVGMVTPFIHATVIPSAKVKSLAEDEDDDSTIKYSFPSDHADLVDYHIAYGSSAVINVTTKLEGHCTFVIDGKVGKEFPHSYTAANYDADTRTFTMRSIKDGQQEGILIDDKVTLSDGYIVTIEKGQTYSFDVQTNEADDIRIHGLGIDIEASQTKYIPTVSAGNFNKSYSAHLSDFYAEETKYQVNNQMTSVEMFIPSRGDTGLSFVGHAYNDVELTLAATDFDPETNTFTLKPKSEMNQKLNVENKTVFMADGTQQHLDVGTKYTFNIQTTRLVDVLIAGMNVDVSAFPSQVGNDYTGPIENYTQLSAVTDPDEVPWGNGYSSAQVDYQVEEIYGDRGHNRDSVHYNHSGEIVYCRVTPIANDYSVDFEADVKRQLDNNFALPGGNPDGDASHIIRAKQYYSTLAAGTVLANYATSYEQGHAGEAVICGTTVPTPKSYTLKFEVASRAGLTGPLESAVRGIYGAYAHGVKLEWFTYHQTTGYKAHL